MCIFQGSAREREHSSDEENTKPSTCASGETTVAVTAGGDKATAKGGLPTSTTSSASQDLPANFRSTLKTLSSENKLLRERLLQLGVSLDSSPLSDQEKELLLNQVCSTSQVSVFLDIYSYPVGHLNGSVCQISS